MQLVFDEHTVLPNGECLSLFWLGQAGFWLEGSSTRILVDPYLSDSLARHAKVLVQYHWGMFSFNTKDPAKIDWAASRHSEIQIIRPQLGKTLKILPSGG